MDTTFHSAPLANQCSDHESLWTLVCRHLRHTLLHWNDLQGESSWAELGIFQLFGILLLIVLYPHYGSLTPMADLCHQSALVVIGTVLFALPEGALLIRFLRWALRG